MIHLRLEKHIYNTRSLLDEIVSTECQKRENSNTSIKRPTQRIGEALLKPDHRSKNVPKFYIIVN